MFATRPAGATSPKRCAETGNVTKLAPTDATTTDRKDERSEASSRLSCAAARPSTAPYDRRKLGSTTLAGDASTVKRPAMPSASSERTGRKRSDEARTALAIAPARNA